ncbi:MAG: imidazole glycerol phosphate synthase subunit HisH [Candidatus Omnitrophica bacterium]|nr:imidazole glycerol phosphate synthase subunit HisH [Candidatus Omnitrophota bacterium]
MIAIIDYHMGNLWSIAYRFKKIGHEVCITSQAAEIAQAQKIILPGVGSFAQGMANLKDLKLIEVLEKRVLKDKIPVLGICLGMQLLTQKSEEGFADGLGWIPAETIRLNFPAEEKLRVPHVGWNTVKLAKPSALFHGMNDGGRFYFTHSYKVVCQESADILAQTFYGGEFVSAVEKDNIYGVLFHPEISHQEGIQLLKNFAERC